MMLLQFIQLFQLARIAIPAIDAALVAFQVFLCILAADFIAGLLHWAEDTWSAPGKSALLDKWIVMPNIEHHRRPGAIRNGTYWEINAVSISIAAAAAALAFFAGVHAWQVYLVIALASQSNQFHMWGHCANPPAPVKWLQKIGLLQTAAHHALHHKRPYGVRYCTTTSYLNPVLDGAHFWTGLECFAELCGASVKRATAARDGF